MTVPVSMGAPYEGSSTASTSLEVKWDHITLDSQTGGSPITKYYLEQYDSAALPPAWNVINTVTVGVA